jgi:hypothetical protein
LNQLPVVARVSRAILSALGAADTRLRVSYGAAGGCRYRKKMGRGYTPKSREAHVLARIHLKIEHEGIGCVWFNDLGVELHEDRVLAKDRIFVHRFEIERDEKGPGHVRIDALAAFDAQYLRDFEQLHPGIHHHLLHSGRSDLGFEFIKDNVMNHES